MLQKPSQVVSEQILILYFKCQNFSSNQLFNVSMLLQRSSYEVMCLQSSPQPVWGWGLVALAFKDQTGPQGPLYSIIKMVKTNKQVN